MNAILLAPHNDDEGLFATFICLRLKPQIVVVYDGTIHEERFGKAKGVEARRRESLAACKILGCKVTFLGLPDRALAPDTAIREAIKGASTVFAPAKQGGNWQHDHLAQFGTVHYATYTKENLTPFLEGGEEIHPTAQEKELKREVLSCYTSQHDINAPHFQAVQNGEPEVVKGVLTAPVRRALRLDTEIS